MTRRYYPSTRERITRAFNEGVKADDGVRIPYSHRNSGKALHRAFIRGAYLAMGIGRRSPFPVVDLSAEFADVIRDVEPELAGRLDGGGA